MKLFKKKPGVISFEQVYLEEKTSLCTYNAESVGKLGVTMKEKG